MPRNRIAMNFIEHVLKQRHGLGRSQRQIAASSGLSQSAVHKLLRRAAQAGLGWPLPPGMDEAALHERLYGARPGAGVPAGRRREPDFAVLAEDLRRHDYLTLQTVWQEYCEAEPGGYSYSHFCKLYRSWLGRRDLTLRHEYRAGERMDVDYAGPTVRVEDPGGGEPLQAAIFVAVPGASSYTYVEASRGQDQASWIESHARALEFFQGSPKTVVCDNLKSAVQRPDRYEPLVSRGYREMADHYGMAVVPARPRKPRDKAKAEAAVLLAERWILAALRHRGFGSLAELNEAIRALLQRLNEKPFRKMPGSRRSRYEDLDRPALQPLPAERFEAATWKRVRAGLDYHVDVGGHSYSVPSELVGSLLEARVTARAVEVFHGGRRVASHPLGREPGGATTLPEHRPRAHREHLQWTPERLAEEAARSGPHLRRLVEAVLERSAHPAAGRRSCVGVVRLAKRCGEERSEAAARRALHFGTISFGSFKSILDKGLDREPLPEDGPEGAEPEPEPAPHGNVRGPDYFAADGPGDSESAGDKGDTKC